MMYVVRKLVFTLYITVRQMLVELKRYPKTTLNVPMATKLLHMMPMVEVPIIQQSTEPPII
jgi:hypothetical protein